MPDHGRELQFGFFLDPSTGDPVRTLEIAHILEELGFAVAVKFLMPGLADAESQIAIPMMSLGQLIGVLVVESRIASIGRSSFTMEHRITAEDSEFGRRRLVALGTFVLVSYAYDREVVVPVPSALVERFEAWEERRLRE